MPLTEEKREELRRSTYEAAAALVHDLRYMRRALESANPNGDDVRLLSGMLRRMLLEPHLVAVAQPRIGRIALQVPDYENTIEVRPGDFVALGFAPVFGLMPALWHDVSMTEVGPDGKPATNITLGNPYEFGRIGEVNKEQMMAERLCRFRGEFITRQHLLQFVCYHSFGVHYEGREERAFDLIQEIIYPFCIVRSPEPPERAIFLAREGFGGPKPKRLIMNLAHLLTFSTGWFLINSPDVIRLQEVIEAEVEREEHG